MAIGPVQLLVLGFEHPDFHGEIIEELEKLRESDTVRLIDSLAVYKDTEGELEVMHLSNLTNEQAIELGSKVAALIGLGIEGEEGMAAGAEIGADAAADGIDIFSGEEWDVLEEIPNDSAAALILIEHHWAVPLRDAIARANGFRIADGFISPLDLVANPIDRYSIGDRTPGLAYGDDGSVTIYLQTEAPAGDKQANWLPAPAGDFRPILRMYQAGPSVLDGTYPLPPIRRTD